MINLWKQRVAGWSTGAEGRRIGEKLFGGYKVSVMQDAQIPETWCTMLWL